MITEVFELFVCTVIVLGECPNGRGTKTSTSRAHRPRVDVKAQNEHGVSELELFFMAGIPIIAIIS
jgi:hypothetical protein